MYSTRHQTRAYGACGATSGLKLLTVAYEYYVFAYGNLDYATPCLAYSSGVLASAHQASANRPEIVLPYKYVAKQLTTAMLHQSQDQLPFPFSPQPLEFACAAVMTNALRAAPCTLCHDTTLCKRQHNTCFSQSPYQGSALL